jgi:hypothetical protein
MACPFLVPAERIAGGSDAAIASSERDEAHASGKGRWQACEGKSWQSHVSEAGDASALSCGH